MKVYNYYLLIFIIGSFLGFVLESFWCFLINHHLESRKGLIYSPLIPIYGIAALLISLIINLFDITNYYQIFIFGLLISLIVEYLSSVFQEKIFHTKSWDYSHMSFNIKGRVNLKYTLMFGIVSLIYSKYFLPKYNLLFKSIKLSILNPFCLIFTLFLMFDIIISCLACYRMKERKQKIKRPNCFWKYIDNKYNDKYLSKIYPNMKSI